MDWSLIFCRENLVLFIIITVIRIINDIIIKVAIIRCIGRVIVIIIVVVLIIVEGIRGCIVGNGIWGEEGVGVFVIRS